MIFDRIASELRLKLKRVSSSKGGEYHSPCPYCREGVDRFIFWPETGRFWCRRCGKSGDEIQLCRDLLGMSYSEACKLVGKNDAFRSYLPPISKSSFTPRKAQNSSALWKSGARKFVDECHENLLKSEQAILLLNERGILLDTAKNFRLGWNPVKRFIPSSVWGIEEKSASPNLFLPEGIVIPAFIGEEVSKIKIRRINYEQDEVPSKYFEVRGGQRSSAIYGDASSSVAIILESELDSVLVQQFAGDLCSCIALGGAQKQPDEQTDVFLKGKSLILLCLDFDEAGNKAYQFWRLNYSNLRGWPIPIEKSPGDAYLAGTDLRKWVLDGIEHCSLNVSKPL